MATRRYLAAFCLLVGLLLASRALGGTLRTRDGKSYQGEIHLEDGAFVVRSAAGDQARIEAVDVERALFVDPRTSPHGLKANYYAGLLFRDLRLSRIDPRIDIDLNDLSPAPDVAPQNVAVRWSGFIVPRYSELYTFRSRAASAFQLWIDDKPVISDWTNRSKAEVAEGKISLQAGHKYKLLAEFFSNTGSGQAHLFWSSRSEVEELVPPQCLIPAPRTPADDTVGLRGEYFGDLGLLNFKVARIDAKIDFDWGHESPDVGVPAENFSVRWTGKILPRHSEKYKIIVVSNGGSRLWVNGQQIVDDWHGSGAHEVGGIAPMLAGQVYDIKLEFVAESGHAAVQLFWSSASQPRELIPTRALVPARPPSAVPPPAATSPTASPPPPPLPTNVAEPEPTPGLVLCDGSMLAGSVVWTAKPAVVVNRKPAEQVPGRKVKPQRPPLRVLKGEIAIAIFASPNAEQQAKLLTAPPGALMSAGDFIEGEVLNIDGGKIDLDSVTFGRITRRRAEVVGVVLRGIKRTGDYEVRTVDGVRLWVPTAAALKIDKGQLIVDQPTLGSVALDEDDLYEVAAAPPAATATTNPPPNPPPNLMGR